MKFRTQYDRVREVTNPGSPIKITYTAKYDEDGVLGLVESGKEDLREYINSFKDSCDINVIVQRFANGDTSVLEKRQGIYADLTDMPKTYAEMLNRIVEGENIFMSLPLDVRNKFDNSFSQFMATFGTSEWNEKMHVDVEKPVEKVDSVDGE